MSTSVNGAPVTWQPTEQQYQSCRMSRFARWSEREYDRELLGFRALWRWSVDYPREFWPAVVGYFDVIGGGFNESPTLVESDMPFVRWFPGVRCNFAENVLRHAHNTKLRDENAIVRVEESGEQSRTTWSQLEGQVASLANEFRRLGVRAGDRVAAVLPNIPEAVVGLLASASIGAVWTINSPDLSPQATVRRVKQLKPKLLLASDGYVFGGKAVSRTEHTAEVERGLPTLEATVLVRNLNTSGDPGSMSGRCSRRQAFDELIVSNVKPVYERVEFSAPLWVLFSSGTTGAPKGIVHGHGGMLLDSLKGIALHQDMGPGDVYYVAANTSWMVWNTLVQNLLSGASIVTYSGSPKVTDKDHHFQIIAETGTTMFATGAAYLSMVEKSGLDPGQGRDLSALRSILATGSPLPHTTWRWVHRAIKQTVHLGSDSGGTDICGGFLGSNPLEPVRLGYLQGPLLGVAVEARNPAGHRLLDDVGEMAVTQPLPSMPLYLWNDPDGVRYRESYFTAEPGVWMHGDWITETTDGQFIVHGRADATLNRQGVRIGPADIYDALQDFDEIEDSMVLGIEGKDGGYWMPLFVVMSDGAMLTDELKNRIIDALRTRASARHVPDEIIEAPGIPTTHTMKRLEVPVKKMFASTSADFDVNQDSVSNPAILEWFQDLASRRRPRE